ncbi:unnamed protein product [Bemisia tabaci]|uniref:Uncharacterized protein n=1 Tax=Bemisia tabaci TaxID=7038 RepID=A0A9P0F1M0_BEMTA|nr:PREDICTED: uncharacterized protein LOC109040332 [Bemisia tabaci]CAH0385839.1 unnamed protein product [Bemisia tabaci]
MGKIKNSVRKTCPECAYQQVAVACKFCPKCKYSFVAKKDTYVPPPSATDPKKEENSKEPNPDNRRRTERVKRVKPNFYDASEFERKPKKRKRGRVAVKDKNEGGLKTATTSDLRRKKRQKRRNAKKKERDNEPAKILLTPEKIHQCSIILAELNRKMAITAWRI